MQQLNPSEISALIKQRISDLNATAEARNEGTVVKVSDGIVRIHGLADVMYGEMIEFEGGLFGMALNLEQDSVGAVVLGNYLGLQEGQKVRCTGRILEVPVGPELLGRVVDALGKPIDGKGATHANGGTIGFAMSSPEQCKAWHDAGVAAGGKSIEDPPGVRSGGAFPMYLAYLRDPDGNKLCALHRMPA